MSKRKVFKEDHDHTYWRHYMYTQEMYVEKWSGDKALFEWEYNLLPEEEKENYALEEVDICE